MSHVHVILSAGHRNDTAGGAAGEAALNLAYANAYAEVLPQDGFKVHYIQRLDDAQDHRPDWFSAGLSQVAKKVASVAEGLPANERIVMFDVHMEAGSASRGLFAIIPDGGGLSGTAANTPDSWEGNKPSRDLGKLIAQEISQATGIPMRFSKELGLMSEKQTGVATELRGRLAMFRHTAHLQQRMIRMVFEHGNMRTDKTLLTAAESPGKAARALSKALTAFFGGHQPVPPPLAPRSAAPPVDGDDHTVNGREFIALARRVTIARDGVPGLQFADPQASPVRLPFKRGEEFEAAFIVTGAPFGGDDRWWVAEDGTRIPMNGTVEKFRRG
ncbi:MAG TPA: hypothetical protein VFR37_22610 [Longimicrobium sp.]|nr:hypothetical protein [Longimicrobium sp.]